ncbi:hypothetical protein PRZ48_008877 [Zasmidium cellare]|uniref:Uncharacterized protein n=1 Tax=Zasmidium cellare TaxID=395010 RepID=A0ABR0EHL5_ZASCE|nr:hypothetical protein PRZ48_008877 [Zasmidium cellare]
MSGHRWQLDERLCLDILHTEFENTRAENHSIFGRMFGQRWEAADRSPYTAQRLYEEHRWRWDASKSKDWDLICIPPLLRTLQQQSDRNQMHQRIIAAAAQNGTNNYFTEEVDTIITLKTPDRPHIETGRPANAKRKASKSARKSTPKRQALSSNFPSASSSSTYPSSAGFAHPQVQLPGLGIQQGARDVAAGPSRPGKGKSQKKASPTKRAVVKAGPDEDRPTPAPRPQERTTSAPATAIANAIPAPAPMENAPPLQMVHSCQLNLTVFPPTYTRLNIDRFIHKSTLLYKSGGHVKRVVEGDKTFDVMVCQKAFCLFCQRQDQYADLPPHMAQPLATRAENARGVIPDSSPLIGLPFIHVWRDCDREPEPNPSNRYAFDPLPPKATNAPELPTWVSEVWFDDTQNGAEEGGGFLGYRQAGLCNPELCDVCKISDERAAELLAGVGP